MNLNNFTIKAQESIAQAQQLAFNQQNQQIETVHVHKALIPSLCLLFSYFYHTHFFQNEIGIEIPART